MLPPTRFLSRLLGLYCILISLAMLIRGQGMADLVTALMHNAPLLFLCGVIALFAGLAMILVHNIWSGGAVPIVVTVIGWGSLIKGILLTFLTPAEAAGFYLGALHYKQFFYVYDAFTMLIGIYLAYGGFSGLRRVD